MKGKTRKARDLKVIKSLVRSLLDQRKEKQRKIRSEIRLIIGATKSMDLKRDPCGLSTLQKNTHARPQMLL